MFDKLFKMVGETTELEPQTTSERFALKAMEELGELAEAINWDTGYKHTDKDESEIKDRICEEGIDTIICIMAILKREGITKDEIKKYYPDKIKKWRKKLEKDNKK